MIALEEELLQPCVRRPHVEDRDVHSEEWMELRCALLKSDRQTDELQRMRKEVTEWVLGELFHVRNLRGITLPVRFTPHEQDLHVEVCFGKRIEQSLKRHIPWQCDRLSSGCPIELKNRSSQVVPCSRIADLSEFLSWWHPKARADVLKQPCPYLQTFYLTSGPD